MIDPNDVTKPDASKAWKEEFLIFCACVAGKGAFQQAKKVDQLLQEISSELEIIGASKDYVAMLTPFELIRCCSHVGLRQALEAVKMGQYERLTDTLAQLVQYNVNRITVEQLEAIPGIGPKTARFFLVHTRKSQPYAVIDTHIMKELHSLGYTTQEKGSPSTRKQYLELERAVLEQAEIEGLTPADWDLKTWKKHRVDAKAV